MTQTEPTPPFELEPDEDTERKYRIGTVVVAVFILVLIAWGIVLILMEPPFVARDYVDVPVDGATQQE